jgi:glycosyltransferase involved in cell wall biosynthesis
MNILFISYWGLKEGLTQSTVIPHLKILSEYEIVNKIILITIERDFISQFDDSDSKIKHNPIRSYSNSIPLIGKILDFIRIPKRIKQYCIDYQIDKIIARGSPAGALAYLTWKKTNIPFIVESFEPHADYMLESGVWGKRNLRYVYQKKWEFKIKKYASAIITVSKNYKNRLLLERISKAPIEVAPCAVDIEKFKFDRKNRANIRLKNNISDDTIVGIYVGKFGDIYYDQEAFSLFKFTFDYFNKNFLLIIISSDNHLNIKKRLSDVEFPLDKLIIENLEHSWVPKYLSVADFGYATIRKSPSRLYCSAIKIGEYWANGLPILMTEGIGDESEFLEKEKGGVLFNPKDTTPALHKLEDLIKDPDHRTRIPHLAKKYRSFDTVREAYEKIILPNIIDRSEDNKD